MSSPRNVSLLFALAFGGAALTAPLGCGGGDTGSTTPEPTDSSVADASSDGAAEAEVGETGCGPGQPGCACLAGGTCSKGECIKDKCVDCARGAESCVCRLNGTCDTGLKCTDGLCAKCTEGTSGCPCAGGTTCDMGLKCSSGTCVADSCVSGATGCGCRATEPRCDTGLYCNAGSTCATCSNDIVGCPCSSGTCTDLVCDAGTCRKPKTCASLVAAGTCVANQKCVEATKTTDATCVAETCVDTYRWDTASKSCVACGLPGYRWDKTSTSCVKCTNDACDAESCGADPLAPTCAAMARGCKVDVDGKVTGCGGCLPGYDVPTGGGSTSTCIAKTLCGAVVCSSSQYCDRTGATPTCTTRPCPVGQAWSDLSKSCIGCGTLACTGAGATGSIWPNATKDDRCICESAPSYFVRAGKQLPELCDADGDGWVRQSADDNATRTDKALAANARCDFHRAARVHLVDEYGIEQIVDSCTTGLKARGTGVTGCPTGEDYVPIRLLEPDPNDGPELRTDPNAPGFKLTDGTTALLAPKQLNGLTKVCADNSDGDLDGVYDLEQAQELKPLNDDLIKGTMPRLRSFAYWTELYTSKFVASTTAGDLGDLYIYERSRCDDEFPFHYDPTVDPEFGGDSYLPTSGPTYWRTCQRNRPLTFSGAGTTAGPFMDFAQWSCSEGSGSCQFLPPASKDDIAPLDPRVKFLRNFGLCSLGGAKPKDGFFRGLNHHSQFRCVSVAATATKAYEIARSEFPSTSSPTTKYTFDVCKAVGCGAGICDVASAAGGTGASTSPKLRCQAQSASSTAVSGVGWALVNYIPYGPANAVLSPTEAESWDPLTSPPIPATSYTSSVYQMGCINEDAHYFYELSAKAKVSYVCPFPQFSSSVSGDSVTMKEYKGRADGSYGRYSCFGDGQNFLWAADPLPTPIDISSLYWADGIGATPNSSVVR